MRALLATLPAAQRELVVVAGLPDGGAVAGGAGRRDRARRARGHAVALRRPAAARRHAGRRWRRSATATRVRALVAVQPALPLPGARTCSRRSTRTRRRRSSRRSRCPADGYLRARDRRAAGATSSARAFAGADGRPAREVRPDRARCSSTPAARAGRSAAGAASPTAPGAARHRSRPGPHRPRPRADRRGPALRDGGAPAAPPAASPARGDDLAAGVARFAVGGPRRLRGGVRRPARPGDRPRPSRSRAAQRPRRASSRPSPAARACSSTRAGACRPSSAPDSRARPSASRTLLGAPGSPAYAAVSRRRLAAAAAPPTRLRATRRSRRRSPAPFGRARAVRGGLRRRRRARARRGRARPGARTHYAFDSAGRGGTVRVIVIDNSRGSLAASDPHQNPPEPQTPWLIAVARRREGAAASRRS